MAASLQEKNSQTDSRNVEPLPWTGERYLPDVRGNIELEHVHRYLVASRLATGKRVLDIACGEGYGSALLARSAARVVGVDIAAEAVSHASSKYKSRNLSFKQGSCAAIPLQNHSVDLVVSFETIEHHDEHDAMMREIKRVLAPDGVLVISSPDRLEYSDKPHYSNPYHVKELYRDEFESLLQSFFKNYQISGQRVVYGSAIFNEGSSGNISSFDINDKVLLPAPGIGHALYLVAIASDSELPILESGVLEQPIEESDYVREDIRQLKAFYQTVAERDALIVTLHQAIADRDEQVAALHQAAAQHDAQLGGLNSVLADGDGQIAGLHDAVPERERQLSALHEAAAQHEGRLDSLNRAVADRDAQIHDLNRAIVDRERQLAALNQAAGQHEGQLDSLNRAVADRDVQIDDLNQAIVDRERQLAALNQAAGQHEGQIDSLNRALADRDVQIADLHQAIVDRERQLAALHQAAAQHEGRLDSLNRAVADREEQIASLDHVVVDRDERLVSLSGVVVERDGQIAHLNRVVMDREQEIAGLNHRAAEYRDQIVRLDEVIHERDGRLAHLIHERCNLDSQVARLDQVVVDGEHQIESQRRHIQALMQSASWRVTKPLRLATGAVRAAFRPLRAAFRRGGTSTPEFLQESIDRIRLSSLFDQTFYFSKNPNVREAGADPAAHYFLSGWRELRDPSERFSTRAYLQDHPDVALADINPLLHYIDYGRAEGRQVRWVINGSGDADASDDAKALPSAETGQQPGFDDGGTSAATHSQQLTAATDRIDAEVEVISKSLLFDATYYVQMYPDVDPQITDPARHYCEYGWMEGRNPSGNFDTRGYLEANSDIRDAGINPLLHYIEHGRAERRRATWTTSDPGIDAEIEAIARSGMFDATYYLAMNPDIDPQSTDPVRHYCEFGWREGLNPSADFETLFYLELYSDIKDAGCNPFVHYIEHGRAEKRRATWAASDPEIDAEVEAIARSGLFDTTYYRAMYPDLDPEIADCVRHYCECGWREGRDPSDDFSTRGYLEAYSDIRNAEINPFRHYIDHGRAEGRQAAPRSRSRYEDEAYFGDATSDIQLVAYYSTPDWAGVQRAHQAGLGQQLLPHEDLGFYVTSEEGTLRKQALLARRHGVIGWCFGWDAAGGSNEGNPLEQLLLDRDIDMRFCVDIDIRSGEFDRQSIACLESALADERYLKIDGRPVLVITLLDQTVDYAEVHQAFEALLIRLEVPELYRIARFNGPLPQGPTDTGPLSFEAILDLPVDPVPGETGAFQPFRKNGVDTVPYSAIVSEGITRMRATRAPGVPVYRAITLGRDDTPANPHRPLSYSRFHLREYRRWLDAAIAETRAKHRQDRRLLFLNAWNDWSHGAVLEPDRGVGYGKLNETSRALLGLASGIARPKVSVIVPNYNHAHYLPRRLESIYRQTYKNFEVLLLDDCSTDQSREVLAEYAERYSGCSTTLFNATNSGGVFHQWAKGIQAASGDLVWIAESDDYCDENFLETLARCFEDEAVMLAYSRTEFVGADESVVPAEFMIHVRGLNCQDKWTRSYVNTAHKEVSEALGIVNTIPNASGVLFRRPLDMPLLVDAAWLSMAVVGDWLFYLHLIRGGKIAYSVETANYFRRHGSSTAAGAVHKEKFYRELGFAAQTVQNLYDVPANVLEQSRHRSKELYDYHCFSSDEEFNTWFDEPAIREARVSRMPNMLVSTMNFHPGGAEILPIRFANELKRMGHSVLLLNVGLGERVDGVRRMLRNDVPVIETDDIEETKNIIRDFDIEVLNSHQWYVQKYPARLPDVFHRLKAHVASLHGMIEHGEAFGVTSEELNSAHENVTTWVYTADKNLGPFLEHGLYEEGSPRFAKLPNGMQPPKIMAISRSEIGMPDDAFVLCCVSRAIPDKGWAEAIEAVALARDLSGRDIRLILVGNGAIHDEYSRTGVPDFVHLAGFSENSVGYYAAADMGIMLTRFRSESFPLTIVDCLFAGRPYISCDVGEIRNILTDGDDVAGAVFPLNDWQVQVDQVAQGIAEYAIDAQKYRDACDVVPRLAARYRIENVVERYLGIFRETLGLRGARHGANSPPRVDNG